ncbi:hypothetical protein SCHPADRAFT_721328 [Schizopora paradoxa]|uniref:Uncharacterized protein n=1 Tax=Schizopora paradoxa TaxID=27342 RepID=A0A0H2R1F1_9AGAM|nr:hypothetical protein SCHPADRAFT_721328 [Schizopora paradoxa]
MLLLRSLLALGTIGWSLKCAFASTETNVTVDDQTALNSTTVVYMPSTTWKQGDGCDFCSAQPNGSLAFDGTWHDASYTPGDKTVEISISFTGTAIYTFFIVPDLNSPATTNLNFTLDGELAGSFRHPLGNVSQFLYNVSTFGKAGLKNAPHTLIIASGGDTSSLLLFDYLVYTTEKHSVPIGEIVGPVVGGTAVIAIILAILFFRRKRKIRRISTSSRSTGPMDVMAERFEPDPYMIRGGDVERGPEKAGIRRAVVVPELLSDSDYTTTSETDTAGSPEQIIRRLNDLNAQREAITSRPLTVSSTGVVDPLPQYESVTRAG